MGRIVVNVMPKTDAQAPDELTAGLVAAGVTGARGVRSGRRYMVTVDGEVTPQAIDAVRAAAATVLADPGTEDVTGVYAEGSRVEVVAALTPEWDDDDVDAMLGGSGAVEAGARVSGPSQAPSEVAPHRLHDVAGTGVYQGGDDDDDLAVGDETDEATAKAQGHHLG